VTLGHPQKIFEPRLQKLLEVAGFRLPPVEPAKKTWQQSRRVESLVGVRFPDWLQCPFCHRLKRANDWGRDPGDPIRYCAICTSKQAGGEKVGAVPVRFVVACQDGHLDEFPWSWWLNHKPGCNKPELKISNDGSSGGLAGVKLSCLTCGGLRSMEGCFNRDALQGIRCRGKRPWLPGPDETCDKQPRTLQRGASNLYFPVILSALDIPPWSDPIQREFGEHWEPLCKEPREERERFVRFLRLPEKMRKSVEEILEIIDKRISLLERMSAQTLRWEEYIQFTQPELRALDDNSEFEVRKEEVPPELRHWIGRVVRATRLREVRAIRGFTRIKPPATGFDPEGGFSEINAEEKKWLPAIEVRGEGIFVELNAGTLAEWEKRPEIQRRATQINAMFARDWKERYGEEVPVSRNVTPRLLLIHSFSHALIRQLALECGYSTASLRERLYVSDGDLPMAAVLIYTATPDSEGTLGGRRRPEADGNLNSDRESSKMVGAEPNHQRRNPLCEDTIRT